MLTHISRFSLNSGGLVVSIGFLYVDSNGEIHDGGEGRYFSADQQTQMLHLDHYVSSHPNGLQDGAIVQIKATLAGGRDTTPSQWFIYQTGNNTCASYVINDTTLDNQLTFKGTAA